MAVRSDHSIDNNDEDGNGAGQEYMVGSEWCCRTCGGKKETKEIMMMLMIQIHCTYRETTHMYIPWMPLFRHIPLNVIEHIDFELNVKRV